MPKESLDVTPIHIDHQMIRFVTALAGRYECHAMRLVEGTAMSSEFPLQAHVYAAYHGMTLPTCYLDVYADGMRWCVVPSSANAPCSSGRSKAFVSEVIDRCLIYR
jgi:hypothetical protein